MKKSNRAKTKKISKSDEEKLTDLISILEKEIQSDINSIENENEKADFQSFFDAIKNDKVVIHTNWESFLEAGRNEQRQFGKKFTLIAIQGKLIKESQKRGIYRLSRTKRTKRRTRTD